ncbi:MAG: hypothetical protein JW900_13525 [Anaerolineae bacterium]|nr:hypothetical protein [Anaerolineae bacterium]
MAQNMIKTGRMPVDFFTHSYRISGHVDVRRKTLPDILNDPMTGFLQLEDAYISPIIQPGEITATYAASSIAKDNLTLALVATRDEALSRDQSYGSYAGSYLRKVFLTVPSLEVVGYLRLSARVDMRRLLTSDTEKFIPVLDGRVQASIRQEVVFTGGGVLVNKLHIGAFCLEEEDQ